MAKYNVWITVEARNAADAILQVAYGDNEDGMVSLVSIDNVSEVE